MIQDKRMPILVDIDDILATTDFGVWVRISKTGNTAWISKKLSNFFQGCVQIPVWLAEKIGAI